MAIKYHLTQQAIDAGCTFNVPRDGDAGYDICALRDFALLRGYAFPIPTGLHVEIPYGYVGIIKDRSGLSSRNDVYIHAGVIDSSYRGECKVLMHNASLSTRSVEFKAGERIAQMLIVPYLVEDTKMVSLDELSSTERGSDGFGSTGR